MATPSTMIDQERPDCRDHVYSGHAGPLLEQDDGGAQHHRREQDVVYGVHHQCVETVQGLVQVVHLNIQQWEGDLVVVL